MKRVVTGIIGAALFLTCSYLGGLWFIVMMNVILLVAFYESLTLLVPHQLRPVELTVSLVAAFLIVNSAYWHSRQWLVFGMTLFVFFLAFQVIASSSFQRVGTLLPIGAALLYVPLLGRSVFFLRGPSDPSWSAFIYILFAVWICDICAYYGGRLWGQTKICPRLSPKKTVEGTVTGWFCAASWLFFSAWTLWPGEVSMWRLLVLVVTLPILSQFGDWFASALKRQAQVKDSAEILPGHGGFLDRFDGFLFAVPFAAWVMGTFPA